MKKLVVGITLIAVGACSDAAPAPNPNAGLNPTIVQNTAGMTTVVTATGGTGTTVVPPAAGGMPAMVAAAGMPAAVVTPPATGGTTTNPFLMMPMNTGGMPVMATGGTPAVAMGGTPAVGGNPAMGVAGAPAMMPVAPPLTPATGSAANCPAVAGWTYTANFVSMNADIPDDQELLAGAFDGVPATRYASGMPQTGTEMIEIDLGEAAMVTGVTLDSTASAGDYGRIIQIELSTDGTNYTEATMGAGLATITSAGFDATEARYIRVNQLGTTMVEWWSVHELAVLCQ